MRTGLAVAPVISRNAFLGQRENASMSSVQILCLIAVGASENMVDGFQTPRLAAKETITARQKTEESA
jgi:hypothetical protein